jgi:hypothetical protein
MSGIFWLERVNTMARGNSPLLEAQISDAFTSVDTRDGTGEKGGESQYRLEDWSAVTEMVRSNGLGMATNLIERLICETNKGDQTE